MKILFAVAILAISGCATQGKSTSQYTEGTKVPIANEISVQGSYSVVWDALVRDLAKSFYVINNIDKESRIINVSFSSNKAEDYVDCGRTVRTFVDGDNSDRYEYAVASRSTFKVATSRQEHPAFSNYVDFSREPTLEGRANIYIAPSTSDAARTTISVNTRYVLSIKVRSEGFAKHISGNIQSRGRFPEENYTHTFNTNSSSSTESGGVNVVCFSKGTIEREILDLLNKR